MEDHSKESIKDTSSQSRKNTSIFISNLPLGTTKEQIADFFASRCGIIMTSLYDGEPRIKLYFDSQGIFKGEALVTFLKEESVDLACTLYDQVDGKIFAPQSEHDWKLSVKPASFSCSSSNSNSSANPKPSKKALEASFARMKEKLSWGQPDLNEKTSKRKAKSFGVKVLGAFGNEGEEREEIELIKEDFLEQCSEEYGRVLKVQDKKNALVIWFEKREDAENCARALQGRWYDGRQLKAHFIS